MKSKDGVVINVRLDKDTYNQLMQIVGSRIIKNPESRYTKSDLIREAIQNFLNSHKKEDLQP